MSERKALDVERADGVATVWLKGPGKGNALGPDFWAEMPEVFDALSEDDDIRAVIVAGRGDHLTYGLDLPAVAPMFMEVMQGEGVVARKKLHQMVERWQLAFDAVEACTKPVLAAATGWCIGGGVNLLAACDMRIASEDAQFSLREVKLAITADLGALQRLPRIIGEGMTRRLAFTGEHIGAERALACGLVDELFADRAACLDGARTIAAEIASNSPLAVQGTKRVLNHALPHQSRDGRAYVAAWNAAFLPSQDLMEAFSAFLEGRDPEFTGA